MDVMMQADPGNGTGMAPAGPALLEAIPACAALLDACGNVLACNAAWAAASHEAASPWEAFRPGAGFLDAFEMLAVRGGVNAPVRAQVMRLAAGEAPTAAFVYVCHFLNGPRWFRAHFSAVPGMAGAALLCVQMDVTEEMANQQRIFALSHFDDLTGLPNRLLFIDRLRSSLAYARRHRAGLAVMMVDIDRLKRINDTLGRDAGDLVLVELGQRLNQMLRKSDTASRLGGDAFGVVVSGIGETPDGAVIARKILATLGKPLRVEGQDVSVTASIGIALYPDDGEDPDLLVGRAESAMHRAKEAGRNCYQYFTDAMNAGALDRMQLDHELRHALARHEFEVFYQPKVSCANGAIVGAEALLRWRHPERGLLSPAEFIPMLEDNGQIENVGAWVLREACRHCKDWAERGLGGGRLRVSVNLSAHQLDYGALVPSVQEALAESGLPPECLELEVTEGMLMRHVEEVIETLHALRKLGVGLSVDDFGTGYSSLAYLKRFPLSAVKVDRSFVQDIAADPNDASITRAVITMAHNLRLKVIAEGVETEAQLSLLIANHCDEIQGYYFSRPVPVDALEAMLVDRQRIPGLPATVPARPRTLLLVDDEENILASLRRLLRKEGYRILTAGSGAEGLALLACNEVDVILSDQRMSGMTGVEFLRHVKTIHPQTVRMVLSGYTELQSITDAINEGAIYKFLTKPWDDDLLRANIEEAFRYKELGDENRRLNGELQTAINELALTNARLLDILAEQEKRLELDRSTLDAVQEVLHCIPFPVIGFDNDGLLVFANRQAFRVLPGVDGLIGVGGTESLPPALDALMQGKDGETLTWDDGGAPWRATCRRFGGGRHPTGRLMVFYPAEAEKPAGKAG